MGSDLLSMAGSRHRAERVPDPGSSDGVSGGSREWRLSWLPGRLVSRNEAISGLMLAGGLEAAEPTQDRLAPVLRVWARELGLSCGEAADLVAAAEAGALQVEVPAAGEVEGVLSGPVREAAPAGVAPVAETAQALVDGADVDEVEL